MKEGANIIQQDGWHHHPVPDHLQLDGEDGQVYATSTKFYEASIKKSLNYDIQNLSIQFVSVLAGNWFGQSIWYDNFR